MTLIFPMVKTSPRGKTASSRALPDGSCRRFGNSLIYVLN